MNKLNKKKIAVFVSGHGTNLQAIIGAQEAGLINGVIDVVISNKADAYALERAEKHGITGIFVNPKEFNSNEEYDRELNRIMEERGVDLIVLAGWLRILTPAILDPFAWKMINIHPSLLPAFGGHGMFGMKVHRAAIEYGVKYSGATAHFVDGHVDGGAIIEQAVVRIDSSDTPETLQAKVLKEEHKLYSQVIAAICDDRVVVNGRHVSITER